MIRSDDIGEPLVHAVLNGPPKTPAHESWAKGALASAFNTLLTDDAAMEAAAGQLPRGEDDLFQFRSALTEAIKAVK